MRLPIVLPLIAVSCLLCACHPTNEPNVQGTENGAAAAISAGSAPASAADVSADAAASSAEAAAAQAVSAPASAAPAQP
jgi:hypothetical protein